MAIQEVKNLITVQEHGKCPRQESGYKDDDSGRIWTISSWFNRWKLGVQYCADRGAKLCTLDEIVEFILGAGYYCNNAYSAHQTGTLIGFVSNGRTSVRAYVYDPSAEELLDIAAKLSDKDEYLDVTERSKIQRKFLNSDRTFVVQNIDLSLSLEADENGDSNYSMNDVVRCFMPKNAVKYAAVIKGIFGSINGRVWLYHSELPKGTMRIRTVGINKYVIGNVYSFRGFGNIDRASGLIHSTQKISS